MFVSSMVFHWSDVLNYDRHLLNEHRWEPSESFSGSEHFIKRFWERASTGGRDPDDLTKFKVDETVFPTGPPRMYSLSDQANKLFIDHSEIKGRK